MKWKEYYMNYLVAFSLLTKRRETCIYSNVYAIALFTVLSFPYDRLYYKEYLNEYMHDLVLLATYILTVFPLLLTLVNKRLKTYLLRPVINQHT